MCEDGSIRPGRGRSARRKFRRAGGASPELAGSAVTGRRLASAAQRDVVRSPGSLGVERSVRNAAQRPSGVVALAAIQSATRSRPRL